MAERTDTVTGHTPAKKREPKAVPELPCDDKFDQSPKQSYAEGDTKSSHTDDKGTVLRRVSQQERG